jgi:HPt (histidine-containing phosphotransfer) domain-containing protein
MSAAPLIDEAVLDDMVSHIGRDALRPVVELFIGESRRLGETIAASVGTEAGRDAVRRAAHSLKSSAGQLGAASLSALAAEIEQAAADGAPLGERAAALQRCLDASAAALGERFELPEYDRARLKPRGNGFPRA